MVDPDRTFALQHMMFARRPTQSLGKFTSDYPLSTAKVVSLRAFLDHPPLVVQPRLL